METVKRASTTTVLKLGASVEAPVKLFKTTGKGEKSPSFVTAGPNGKPLRAAKKAVESGVDETEPTDVFGIEDEAEDSTVVPAAKPVAVMEDPGPEERPPVPDPGAAGVAPIESAPGQFKTVMIEEETGVEVEPEEVRKGIRREDGTFIDLTGQLEAIDEETKLDQIQVLDFIRRERVPRERIVGSYYLAAGDKGRPMKILRVLYEAMRRTERVAIVRWTKVKGQSVGILVPHGSGALAVLEVVFADAARKPNSVCLAHMRAEVTERQVDGAVKVIEAMSGPAAALDDYFDRRDQLRRQLVDKAEMGDDLGEFAVVEKPADEIEELEALFERTAAG
ncbi:MAG: Ku protein [Solirubrobacterales bacterium]